MSDRFGTWRQMAVFLLLLASTYPAHATQSVTVRGSESLVVEHLLPPASTRTWKGLQRLIGLTDLRSFSLEGSEGLSLISVSTSPSQSDEQRFISKDRLVRSGSMGRILMRRGTSAYQINVWLDPKLICIPKHEVIRVYGLGKNRQPLPPELVDSQENGADETTPADGIYHVSEYKTAAGQMEISFGPSGCVDGVSLLQNLN